MLYSAIQLELTLSTMTELLESIAMGVPCRNSELGITPGGREIQERERKEMERGKYEMYKENKVFIVQICHTAVGLYEVV